MVAFMLGGCSSNEAEEANPRDISILIGRTSQELNLIELDGDKLIVTLFSLGWRSDFAVLEENVFNERLLDDFRAKFWRFPMNLEDRSPGLVRVIIEKETIELSQSQLNAIWRLIENVVDGEADREFELAPVLGHIDYVWAIVDGYTYWSLYESNVDSTGNRNQISREWHQFIVPYVNRDLLLLVYRLIELSPPSSIGSSWRR